jgi:hypothetical protein
MVPLLSFLGCLLAAPDCLQAQLEPAPPEIFGLLDQVPAPGFPAPPAEQDELGDPPPTLSELLTMLIREAVEERYEKLDDWGATVRRWDGLHVRGLKTSRRWKDVNHGFWRRYSASLLAPEETLRLHVETQAVEGESPFRLLVWLQARARCETTFATWVYGVKGLNGTVVADADLEVQLQIRLDRRPVAPWEQLLPWRGLHPNVEQVRLKLRDLDVRKVGLLGGEAAQLIGEGSQLAVAKLVETQERSLQRRLQKRFDRWFAE